MIMARKLLIKVKIILKCSAKMALKKYQSLSIKYLGIIL
jgi:hypothetical protein